MKICFNFFTCYCFLTLCMGYNRYRPQRHCSSNDISLMSGGTIWPNCHFLFGETILTCLLGLGYCCSLISFIDKVTTIYILIYSNIKLNSWQLIDMHVSIFTMHFHIYRLATFCFIWIIMVFIIKQYQKYFTGNNYQYFAMTQGCR